MPQRPLRHHPPRPGAHSPPPSPHSTLAGLLAACSDDDGSHDSADAAAATTTTTTAAATTTTTSAPALSAEEQAALETHSVDPMPAGQRHRGSPRPARQRGRLHLVRVPAVPSEDWNTAQEACQYVLEAAAPPEASGDDAAAGVALPAGWERVVPGGDCHCADGSEFAFWERRADPDQGRVVPRRRRRLVTDATTCAFTGLSAGGGRSELRLEHLRRRPVTRRRDLRPRPDRQPVRRLQHSSTVPVVHR